MTRPTPPLPDGLFEYTYIDKEDGEAVTCHWELHRAENFCGVDFKARASLWHAYKEGIDIEKDLTYLAQREIEAEALKEYLERD